MQAQGDGTLKSCLFLVLEFRDAGEKMENEIS